LGIEENKETLQRYFDEIMNNGDYSKAGEILHRDFSGSAGGGLRGIEGHKQYRDYMFSAAPDGHWETLEMIAEGDKVVIFNEFTGTFKVPGEFQGIPPTNRPFTRVIAGVYEFEDGKIIRGLTRQVSDMLPVLQQLGFLPSTEAIIKSYKESHNLE
jgi:predicted ester cyclase